MTIQKENNIRVREERFDILFGHCKILPYSSSAHLLYDNFLTPLYSINLSSIQRKLNGKMDTL